MEMVKVHTIAFKRTGKFKYEGEYETARKPMFAIVDELKQNYKFGQIPGMKYVKDPFNYILYVNAESDEGYPTLIVPDDILSEASKWGNISEETKENNRKIRSERKGYNPPPSDATEEDIRPDNSPSPNRNIVDGDKEIFETIKSTDFLPWLGGDSIDYSHRFIVSEPEPLREFAEQLIEIVDKLVENKDYEAELIDGTNKPVRVIIPNRKE